MTNRSGRSALPKARDQREVSPAGAAGAADRQRGAPARRGTPIPGDSSDADADTHADAAAHAAHAASGGPIQPNVPVSWSHTGGSPRFWILVVLTGVGAGLGAIVLMGILHDVQHLAYGYERGSFESGVAHAARFRPVVAMTAGGIIMATSWYLLRRIAHGERSLSDAIWHHAGRLPFVSTVTNGVLQMIAVAFGATLGREGAPKEVGAAIASTLANFFRLNDTQRKVLVACGAGAGMSAVYNVPLGGALFGAEVLLGTVSLPAVTPAIATSAVATAVSWLALPNHPTYQLPALPVNGSELLWAVLFGPVAGLVTAWYVQSISWAKKKLADGWVRSVALVAVFAATGAVAMRWPGVLGNGKDVTQLAFTGALGVGLVAALLILRPIATSAFLRAGAVGGLFTPTLTAGVLLGSLAGHGWEALTGIHAPIPVYAAIGGTALLAATMQGPLAAVVLMLELTGTGISLIVPMLVALTGAMLVARMFDDRSIYSVSRARTIRHFGARRTGP